MEVFNDTTTSLATVSIIQAYSVTATCIMRVYTTFGRLEKKSEKEICHADEPGCL